MEAKHTPGAMRTAELIWQCMDQQLADSDPDKFIAQWAEVIDRETAAPELLEALNGLIDDYGLDETIMAGRWDSARSAIAHATE